MEGKNSPNSDDILLTVFSISKYFTDNWDFVGIGIKFPTEVTMTKPSVTYEQFLPTEVLPMSRQ